MRIVVALGGNALLRRGHPLTAEHQRQNVEVAAAALAPIAREHELVISHGNGPQVGLLALQGAAYRAEEAYPLDILDAQTEGMIGYLIEQALQNHLGPEHPLATLLTQIEVAADDPAFLQPSKPIGPLYGREEAERLAQQRGWAVAADGAGFRRVVPSPQPRRIIEMAVIALLVRQGVLVTCSGGGGIPVVRDGEGNIHGVEAVIDKDAASALLARELGADRLLLLTDVAALYSDWGLPGARPIRRISAQALRGYTFAPGSMGPKVAAACDFVERSGGVAAIGALQDAGRLLRGEAGTVVEGGAGETLWWE